MIKLEKTEVVGWEPAIRGMRNPMNSWEKSDSQMSTIAIDEGWSWIGPNDHDLMMRLAKGGPVHAKYRRMIMVYVDITAPLYWWKEFDTYKVGTVANSCSTMHKIHSKEFTREDFSCERLMDNCGLEFEFVGDDSNVHMVDIGFDDVLDVTIQALNWARQLYLETGEKCYWEQMIQLLPSSYNQKRTVMMSYEVLVGIYRDRKNHKLKEWHDLCDWIEGLPYSEVITGHKDGTPVDSPVSYKYSASINGQLIEGYTTAGENATDDEIRRAILDTVCEGLSYEKN